MTQTLPKPQAGHGEFDEFPYPVAQDGEYDGPTPPWMSRFSADYGVFLQRQLDLDVLQVPNRILAMLRASDALVQGFEVTQLVHGLQTAAFAEQAGADIDVVVASLCHDMGKVISTPNHSAISAEMIKLYVSDDAYWMVKVHQDFEGVHYFGTMGLDPMLRRQHKDHPAYDLAKQFADEWDQKAFDVDMKTPPLEHYVPMIEEVFTRKPKLPETWAWKNPVEPS
jgi:predicted HD phosphohydrolase